MVMIKIEVGFDKERVKKKRSSDVKKTVFLTALLDSAVWIADTALLLKLFYGIPLYPFGIWFITGVILLYFIYLIAKTQIVNRKFGKKLYKEEFGHTGLLLVAVSALLVFFLIVMSYA